MAAAVRGGAELAAPAAAPRDLHDPVAGGAADRRDELDRDLRPVDLLLDRLPGQDPSEQVHDRELALPVHEDVDAPRLDHARVADLPRPRAADDDGRVVLPE